MHRMILGLAPGGVIGLTLWRAPFLQHIEERSAAKETKTTYHK